MPTFTVNGVHRIPYADEQTTLGFANKVRESAGGDLLPGLMPSASGNATACLIANALNFSSRVVPMGRMAETVVKGIYHDEGEYEYWVMFPKTVMSGVYVTADLAARDKIAAALDLKVWSEGVILPRLIGNVADAFDRAARGWTRKYGPNTLGDF